MGDNICYQDVKGLIYIKGQCYSKNVNFLIDTGSEASLLNSSIINELKLEKLCFKVPKITLVSANNKKLYEVSMGIIAKVKLQDIEYPMQFLLVNNMSHEAIIGTDELNKNGVIIDYLKGIIQINEEVIQFNQGKMESNLIENIQIKPKLEMNMQ